MPRTPSVENSLDLFPRVGGFGGAVDDRNWTDPPPKARYELRYEPTVAGAAHDQALFEWTLEWLECEDVATVRVDRQDEDAAPVRVAVDTAVPCSRAGETAEHRELVEELSRFGRLRTAECHDLASA